MNSGCCKNIILRSGAKLNEENICIWISFTLNPILLFIVDDTKKNIRRRKPKREKEREKEKRRTERTNERAMSSPSPSPIWTVVTDHPDIFEAHIATKLNCNDVKFFYDVNRESRAAIKRSGVRLADAFKIGDFDTTPTLSWARAARVRSPWPGAARAWPRRW